MYRFRVVMHQGFDLTGHYFTYARLPTMDHWLVFDDSNVNFVPIDVVTGLQIIDPTAVPRSVHSYVYISSYS